MKNHSLLILGLSILAFAIGFMVGGSASPVVGVVVPLLFGLAVSFFSFFTPYGQLKNLPESILNNKEIAEKVLENVDKQSSRNTQIAGLALIFFSTFYLFGAYCGMNARINGWILKKEVVVSFPWTAGDEPKNMEDALSWIELHGNLKNLGYSDSQISSLYTILLAEWKRNKVSESSSSFSESIKRINKHTLFRNKTNPSENKTSSFISPFVNNTPDEKTITLPTEKKLPRL